MVSHPSQSESTPERVKVRETRRARGRFIGMEPMIEIPVSTGRGKNRRVFAKMIVDDQDADLFQFGTVSVSENVDPRYRYPIHYRPGFERHGRVCHIEIAERMNGGTIPKGLRVNHIDHDPMNAQRSNIEIITHQQNIQHRVHLDANNTSGARGLTWSDKHQRWVGAVAINGKRYYAGYFHREDYAGACASVAALRTRLGIHGENHTVEGRKVRCVRNWWTLLSDLRNGWQLAGDDHSHWMTNGDDFATVHLKPVKALLKHGHVVRIANADDGRNRFALTNNEDAPLPRYRYRGKPTLVSPTPQRSEE